MFLREPVPIHLKFVVAYCKILGKCLIFFSSKSPWQPLRFREHRGDVCSEHAKATPSAIQVSGHALPSLPQPDSSVSQQILNAFPQACISVTPVARLVGLPANIECLSMSVHCPWQTHWSPGKYWMHFHELTRGKTTQKIHTCYNYSTNGNYQSGIKFLLTNWYSHCTLECACVRGM